MVTPRSGGVEWQREENVGHVRRRQQWKTVAKVRNIDREARIGKWADLLIVAWQALTLCLYLPLAFCLSSLFKGSAQTAQYEQQQSVWQKVSRLIFQLYLMLMCGLRVYCHEQNETQQTSADAAKTGTANWVSSKHKNVTLKSFRPKWIMEFIPQL